jgi:hypothetical protein
MEGVRMAEDKRIQVNFKHDCVAYDGHSDCYICGEKIKDVRVEHPVHYTFSQYEVFDVLMAWFSDDPLLWQVGKYIARCKHKGDAALDLKKAKWYIEKAIEREEKK